MSRRVAPGKFDEVRGKLKQHRKSMKAFTKERQRRMEHHALLNTTRQMHKIEARSELEMNTLAGATMKRAQSLKQMRKQSMKQLRKQSTKQLLMFFVFPSYVLLLFDFRQYTSFGNVLIPSLLLKVNVSTREPSSSD